MRCVSDLNEYYYKCLSAIVAEGPYGESYLLSVILSAEGFEKALE